MVVSKETPRQRSSKQVVRISTPLDLYKALMSPESAEPVRPYEYNLNDQQRKAFEAGLKSNVALIQGPPGTGKSYVGKAIVGQWLSSRPPGTPALIVCHTNRAVDSFLEATLEFTNKGTKGLTQ